MPIETQPAWLVNLVDEAIAEPMNHCAASLPYGESELAQAGLNTARSSVVKPPRIAEAPASLECTEWDTLQIGENRVVIGVVKRLHCAMNSSTPKSCASARAALPDRPDGRAALVLPHPGSIRDDSAEVNPDFANEAVLGQRL